VFRAGGTARAVIHPTTAAPVSIRAVQAAIADLQHDNGITSITTPALGTGEAAAFIAAGFEVQTELILLRHDFMGPILRPDPAVTLRSLPRTWRRARREAWFHAALQLDSRAFPADEQFDELSLHDALRATPQVRFRFAIRSDQPASRSNQSHSNQSHSNLGDLDTAQVVGYAITGRAERRGYLQRLAVDPSAQRLGIGRSLCRDGLVWAQRRGVRVMAVNTRPHNSAALALYESIGYRRLAERLVVLQLPTERFPHAQPEGQQPE
jgi:ribosomal protein S18 acetylase RimI-like enzyme